MSRERVPEPWMFAAEVTVNGEPVQPTIGKFTLMGRLRIRARRLLGRPPLRGTPTDAEETP